MTGIGRQRTFQKGFATRSAFFEEWRVLSAASVPRVGSIVALALLANPDRDDPLLDPGPCAAVGRDRQAALREPTGSSAPFAGTSDGRRRHDEGMDARVEATQEQLSDARVEATQERLPELRHGSSGCPMPESEQRRSRCRSAVERPAAGSRTGPLSRGHGRPSGGTTGAVARRAASAKRGVVSLLATTVLLAASCPRSYRPASRFAHAPACVWTSKGKVTGAPPAHESSAFASPMQGEALPQRTVNPTAPTHNRLPRNCSNTRERSLLRSTPGLAPAPPPESR